MNRRSFIRGILAGVAGVFVAPLMRRSEVKAQSVGTVVNTWGDKLNTDLDQIRAWIDCDKIRFVRNAPISVIGGWEK